MIPPSGHRQHTKAGIAYHPGLVVNFLSTQIAMWKLGKESRSSPHSRSRNAAIAACSRVASFIPRVHLDFYQIRRGGRTLAPAAEEFTSFLQTYVPRWAAQGGLL